MLLGGELAQSFSAGVELVGFAFLFKQLIVGATLNDMASLQDHDDIAILDGGEAVGDDENRSALHNGVHAALDEFFGAAIDGRGSLVENQNGRVRTGCAGNGEQLSLTLG